MTNFQLATLLNECIGNAPNPENWETAEQQYELINEEVAELSMAIAQQDITELRDAIADVLVTVYGLAYRMGIDADSDYYEIHRSNMSKLLFSEQEAFDEERRLRNQGIDVSIFKSKHNLYALTSAKDQTNAITQSYLPKNKLLKQSTYCPPKLD